MQQQQPYPSPDTPSREVESTASRLERLSAIVIDRINAFDFDFSSKEGQEFTAHVHPQWTGEIDTFPQKRQIRSFEEQKALWRQRAEENPNVHFEIVQMSSTVHEVAGFARVTMSMEVTGVGDVTLHAMNEMQWKRYEGVWLCFHTIGMRGSPGNAGGYG